MSIQRRLNPSGTVRYRARIKFQGQQITSRTFARRTDAVAWEHEQSQRLRLGEWFDPRRGKVRLEIVAEAWLLTRDGVKRRTRENDRLTWKNHIQPAFGRRPVSSITTAEIAEWAAQLVACGLSAATARRAVSTIRSIFEHAIADERVARNPAAKVKPLRGSLTHEGQALTESEVVALAEACRGALGDLVIVLAYTGLRWGELAGLKISDRVSVPGPGLRVQRAALAGGGRGDLYIDSLKNHQARTVPLTSQVVPIITKWAGSRPSSEWIFPTSAGTPLREGNWKRSVGWTEAKAAIEKPTLRVHDLRHTAASIWLGAGADVKVVQRVLGHASATVTVDLYGHMIDTNLWENAARVGGPSEDHNHYEEGNDNHAIR